MISPCDAILNPKRVQLYGKSILHPCLPACLPKILIPQGIHVSPLVQYINILTHCIWSCKHLSMISKNKIPNGEKYQSNIVISQLVRILLTVYFSICADILLPLLHFCCVSDSTYILCSLTTTQWLENSRAIFSFFETLG